MSFFRGLPFAQVREDAEVELFVAGQRPIERGLIIASGERARIGTRLRKLVTRAPHSQH